MVLSTGRMEGVPKPSTPAKFLSLLCIPLCDNSFYILFVSSERLGNFYLNFTALIQASIEIF